MRHPGGRQSHSANNGSHTNKRFEPANLWFDLQVGRKAAALAGFLGEAGGGAAFAHAALVLANRIVAQCEVQVPQSLR